MNSILLFIRLFFTWRWYNYACLNNCKLRRGENRYSRFGAATGFGVEIAHARAALEYNFTGNVAGIRKDYPGIKIGVLIGGGRIDD